MNAVQNVQLQPEHPTLIYCRIKGVNIPQMPNEKCASANMSKYKTLEFNMLGKRDFGVVPISDTLWFCTHFPSTGVSGLPKVDLKLQHEQLLT